MCITSFKFARKTLPANEQHNEQSDTAIQRHPISTLKSKVPTYQYT